MGYESDVTLVEFKTHLQHGQRHNCGHVKGTYFGAYLHKNALGNIVLVARAMVVSNEYM